MAERLDRSGLSYFWSLIKPMLMKGIGVFYIEGPDTDTVGEWTGEIEGITAYEDGLTIIYVPAVAGKSGGTTLNLNNLGDVPCYYTNTTVVATHYAAGTPILFTYRGGAWRRADYNSNTTYSGQTAAMLTAGTNTSARTIRADVFKAALKAVVTQSAGKVKVYDSEVGVGLNQGSENAGKFLAVGSDGNIELVPSPALPDATGVAF